MQSADVVNLNRFHCARVETVKMLIKQVQENNVVFVRGSTFTGKSSLAKLCVEYCKSREDIQCMVIDALIHVTQNGEKEYCLSDFMQDGVATLVIIDEVGL